jgi:hypothetical protein
MITMIGIVIALAIMVIAFFFIRKRDNGKVK